MTYATPTTSSESVSSKTNINFTFRFDIFTAMMICLRFTLLIGCFCSAANAFPNGGVQRDYSYYGSSNGRNGVTASSRPTVIQGMSLDSLSEAWTAYSDALEANPLTVKSITASVILGAADLAGQSIEKMKKKSEGTITTSSASSNDSGVDVARVIRFAVFGLVLQAPWNHFYYLLLDGAIPPTPEPFTTTTGVKVFIDQFIQAPIFTVLIFAFLGTLEGRSPEEVKKQLDEDYVDTMLANWKLFIPATIINIGFVPPIFRVLYLNTVFFFWSIFLSLKLNKEDVNEISK